MYKKSRLIFSGSASEKLTEKMSAVLQVPLGAVEKRAFANSEFRLRVVGAVRHKACTVVQTTSRPVGDNLLELFFLVDTLNRSGAKRVVAVIPYFGYSRQHTAFRSGECVSADSVLKMLRAVGAAKVVTFDFHSVESITSSPLPVIHVSTLPFLAHSTAKQISVSNAVVVSPDEGGAARAKLFSDCLFGEKGRTVVVIKKRRAYAEPHQVRHERDVVNDATLSGKTVILVDDICTTGQTLLSAVALCAKRKARKIYAVVVHADMDEAVLAAIQDSPLATLFTTNTIEKVEKMARPFSKVKVIDIGEVAKLLLRYL